MGRNQQNWSESLTEQVADLWNKTRLSATEIGRKLGRTRNSVLGKINRMGLLGTSLRVPCVNGYSHKPKLKKAARRTASPRALRPRSRGLPGGVLPLPGEAPVTALNIPFMETNYGQCRYMEGDERICCGLPTVKWTSWCPHHYQVVFKNAS